MWHRPVGSIAVRCSSGAEMPLLLARLMARYCFAGCHLSSVVLCNAAGGRADRPSGAWAVGRLTLHGGPVVLRRVRATHCWFLQRTTQQWLTIIIFNVPDNLALLLGDVDPIYYMVPCAHPSLPSNQHLDRFSLFCRVHERDQQTHRHTDHATPSVAIGRIWLSGYCCDTA